jgi:hypothetical protein
MPRRAVWTLLACALFLGLGPSLGRARPASEPVLADSIAPAPPAPPAADSLAPPAGEVLSTPVTPVPTPAPQAAPAADAKPAKAPKPKKVKPPGKPYAERRQEDGVYAAGANWLSLRFGYAKRAEDLSGNGFVGYGMGYQRMLTKRWAFAAMAGHDVVGHYGSQLDIALPFMGEFQRHFAWKSAARPFVGLGGGYYFRKSYRTGVDYTTTTTGGGHVAFGLLSAVTDRHVVGIETRLAFLKGDPDVVNPTFGPGVGTETLWTAKLSWALVY